MIDKALMWEKEPTASYHCFTTPLKRKWLDFEKVYAVVSYPYIPEQPNVIVIKSFMKLDTILEISKNSANS